MVKEIYKLISKEFKDLVLNWLWPIVKAVAALFEDRSTKNVKQKDWYAIEKNLQVGDVLLSVGKSPFSSMFVPGLIKHSALVVSTDEPALIEAVSAGVVKTGLFDFVKNKRIIYHVRPNFIGEDGKKHATKEADKLLGRPYDNLFSMENKKLYCSELIYICYKKAYELYSARDSVYPLETEKMAGEDIYLPDAMRTDTKNWDLIHTSDNV